MKGRSLGLNGERCRIIRPTLSNRVPSPSLDDHQLELGRLLDVNNQ